MNKNRNPETWGRFLASSKALRTEVRRVRVSLLKTRMKKGTREFWGEVNKLMGKTSSGEFKLEKDGVEISNAEVIAESFSEFFSEKVNGILGDYIPFDPPTILGECDNIPTFTYAEIKSALQRLTNKKCSGMDGIPCSFIKEMGDVIAPYILTLFNKVVQSNNIPETWKISRICPVLKKGSSLKVENYRPVSNLNSIAKLFEICLLQRLELFDNDFMMSTSQHGFRKKHSTISAAASIISHLSEEAES